MWPILNLYRRVWVFCEIPWNFAKTVNFSVQIQLDIIHYNMLASLGVGEWTDFYIHFSILIEMFVTSIRLSFCLGPSNWWKSSPSPSFTLIRQQFAPISEQFQNKLLTYHIVNPAFKNSLSVIVGVSNRWVMSHMNEACHIRMRHVTYEWVPSHTNESWHIWTSHGVRDSTSVPACAPASYIAHGMQCRYSVECRCGVRVCVAVWFNVLQCSEMSTQLHCMSRACALPFFPLRLCKRVGTQDTRVQLVWKSVYSSQFILLPPNLPTHCSGHGTWHILAYGTWHTAHGT